MCENASRIEPRSICMSWPCVCVLFLPIIIIILCCSLSLSLSRPINRDEDHRINAFLRRHLSLSFVRKCECTTPVGGVYELGVTSKVRTRWMGSPPVHVCTQIRGVMACLHLAQGRARIQKDVGVPRTHEESIVLWNCVLLYASQGCECCVRGINPLWITYACGSVQKLHRAPPSIRPLAFYHTERVCMEGGLS